MMASRKTYKIFFEGLKSGTHHFKYHLKDSFFERHPYGLISKGDVEVDLEFEKQQGVFELTFGIKGEVVKPCDKCLRDLHVPVKASMYLVVRLGEGEDEDDVIYIPANSYELDVEQYLYEFTSIATPLHVYCREYNTEDCPKHVRDLIIESDEDIDQSANHNNPFKEAFKDLNLTDN